MKYSLLLLLLFSLSALAQFNPNDPFSASNQAGLRLSEFEIDGDFYSKIHIEHKISGTQLLISKIRFNNQFDAKMYCKDMGLNLGGSETLSSISYLVSYSHVLKDRITYTFKDNTSMISTWSYDPNEISIIQTGSGLAHIIKIDQISIERIIEQAPEFNLPAICI